MGLTRSRLLRWTFAALLVTCLGVGVYVLYARDSQYRAFLTYDVEADQAFAYAPTHGRTITLEGAADGLTWPAIEGDWDSAFIELNVTADALGRWLDPAIEIRTEQHAFRQYLERGVRGRRFLNVTRLLRRAPDAGSRIRLSGSHLSWTADNATLHLLRDASVPPGPMLVLAPHPDDAEIAAFGVYSEHPAWVVTVTLGDAGGNLYRDLIQDTKAAFAEKARVRRWDSLTIPQLGNVPASRVANLGYFDGTLTTMFQHPTQPVAALETGARDVSVLRSNPLDQNHHTRDATWNNLLADMTQLLATIAPSSIVLPHPQLDTHPDHQLTTIALLAALQRSGLSHGRLLLYTNHCDGSEIHPFGPRDGVVSIPPSHDKPAYFDSVLSQSLSHVQQVRKGFALQTEHDLRSELFAPPESLQRLIRNSLTAPLRRVIDVDLSYDRRAVRPNELFLVVEYTNAHRLMDAYMADHHPDPR